MQNDVMYMGGMLNFASCAMHDLNRLKLFAILQKTANVQKGVFLHAR